MFSLYRFSLTSSHEIKPMPISQLSRRGINNSDFLYIWGFWPYKALNCLLINCLICLTSDHMSTCSNDDLRSNGSFSSNRSMCGRGRGEGGSVGSAWAVCRFIVCGRPFVQILTDIRYLTAAQYLEIIPHIIPTVLYESMIKIEMMQHMKKSNIVSSI